MKQFRQLFLLTMLALVAFSCNKDDDDDNVNPKVRLLARNAWSTTAITVNPAVPVLDSAGDPTGQFITDLFANQNGCVKDDILKLQENQTYVFDEGSSKCNADDGQVFEAGDWYLSVSENTVVLKSGAFSGVGALYNDGYIETSEYPSLVNWDIEELTESSFKISYKIASGTTVYTITRTFSPIQ